MNTTVFIKGNVMTTKPATFIREFHNLCNKYDEDYFIEVDTEK